MGFIKPVCFFLLLSVFIACGKNQATIISPGRQLGGEQKPSTNPDEKPIFFQGSFISLEGKKVIIDENITKPVVIIFSSESCLICRQEAKNLAAKFNSEGKIPSNIELYTVLIEADMQPEDLLAFKEELGISWTLGYLPSEAFYKKLCPGGKTPCIVVQLPQKGFVYQKTGLLDIAEIETFTGGWQ